MLAAVVLVGFVWLAVACVAMFGPLGMLPWLVCYGLFLAVSRALLKIVGDE